MTELPTLDRTAARLFLATDDTPRALNNLQRRAGYSQDGGRPYYRAALAGLIRAGLIQQHEPAERKRIKTAAYSRTSAGHAAASAVAAAHPRAVPLTRLNPDTNTPEPLPERLTDPQARLLLALHAERDAPQGSTMSRLLKTAGYKSNQTGWFQARMSELTARHYAHPDLSDLDDDARRYRITPSGTALALALLALAPHDAGGQA